MSPKLNMRKGISDFIEAGNSALQKSKSVRAPARRPVSCWRPLGVQYHRECSRRPTCYRSASTISPASRVRSIREAEAIFLQHLRRVGLKQTEQRNTILRTFLETREHLSTDELHRLVKKKDAGIGFTTVYRTLKLLAGCGLASEVAFHDGIARFEHQYNRRGHRHGVHGMRRVSRIFFPRGRRRAGNRPQAPLTSPLVIRSRFTVCVRDLQKTTAEKTMAEKMTAERPTSGEPTPEAKICGTKIYVKKICAKMIWAKKIPAETTSRKNNGRRIV